MRKREEKVGVIGGGVMGIGIAQLALLHGHSVTIVEVGNEEQQKTIIEKIHTTLSGYLDKMVSKNKLTPEKKTDCLNRLDIVFSISNLNGVSLVIEAVTETLELKQNILQEVEKWVKKDTLITTNTSTLSITALASSLSDPGRLVGLHFFNPPLLMRLVEIVKGLETRTNWIEEAQSWAKHWGKEVVFSSSSPGFIVNRVARPYYCESLSILDEGFHQPQVIDDLLTGSGIFPLGVFSLIDLIGVDTNYRNTEEMFKAFHYDKRYKPSLTQKEYVEAKRWGKKVGRGFYDYSRPPISKTTKNIETPSPITKHNLRIEVLGSHRNGIDIGKAFEKVGVKVHFKKSPISEINLTAYEKKKETHTLSLIPSSGQILSQAKVNKRIKNTLAYDLILDFNMVKRFALTDPKELGIKQYESVQTLLTTLFSWIDKEIIFIPNIPGMIVQRIVVTLINEALLTIGEGVATDEDIDKGMSWGMNFKSPPLEMVKRLGYDYIYQVLDHLFQVTKNEKYRPAIELIRRKEK